MRARGKKKLPRTGGRVIKGRLWMGVAAVLLVAGMAGFAGRMQRAEQALLEPARSGGQPGLLSESAAEGMEAGDRAADQTWNRWGRNVTYLSVDPVQLNLLSAAAVSSAQQKIGGRRVSGGSAAGQHIVE